MVTHLKFHRKQIKTITSTKGQDQSNIHTSLTQISIMIHKIFLLLLVLHDHIKFKVEDENEVSAKSSSRSRMRLSSTMASTRLSWRSRTRSSSALASTRSSSTSTTWGGKDREIEEGGWRRRKEAVTWAGSDGELGPRHRDGSRVYLKGKDKRATAVKGKAKGISNKVQNIYTCVIFKWVVNGSWSG